MTAARTLGISYKRFLGWEPKTFYEYDAGGRMVSSWTEVEWDDTEREWMLALAEWEASEVCPMCGWPKDVCQARDAENALEVGPPIRCHVVTAIRRAQEARPGTGVSKHDDALIWGASLKPGAVLPGLSR
ncbi:hypothetical protein [Isoptericola sp. NPDC056605]|uniref:hypothetical protein n=1 Tax=Isoptericola sp. NPDC056605 TaxID=3345876 RepID=UPI0036A686F9